MSAAPVEPRHPDSSRIDVWDYLEQRREYLEKRLDFERDLTDGRREAAIGVLTERLAQMDKQYAERHEALKATIKAEFIALRASLDKADQALKEYKATSNEFRGTLADQASNLMPRQETMGLLGQVRESIDRLREEKRTSTESSAREFGTKIDAMKTEIQALREGRVSDATKDRYADPQIAALQATVATLQAQRMTGEGHQAGKSNLLSGAAGIIAAVALLLGIGTAIYNMTRASVPVAPVYAPVPGGQGSLNK